MELQSILLQPFTQPVQKAFGIGSCCNPEHPIIGIHGTHLESKTVAVTAADSPLGRLVSDMSIPDPHCGYLVVVGENAQCARIQEKMLSGTRRQPNPSRPKHAQDMPMRE